MPISDDSNNKYKAIDLRKGWLPVTTVIGLLCIILPTATVWAVDRQVIHHTADMVKDMEPRVRMVETRIEVQAQTNTHILEMLRGIDKRLERMENR